MKRWTSGSRFVASRWRCQVTNPHSRMPPAARTKRVSENPKMVMGEFFGLTHPQVLDWRTPKTKTPRPAADRTEPTDVELRSGIRARGVRHLPHHDQDKCGDEDLADEHDPPREYGCRHPPTIGPTAIPHQRPRQWPRKRPSAGAPASCRRFNAASAGKTSDAPMPSSTDHPRASTATDGTTR